MSRDNDGFGKIILYVALVLATIGIANCGSKKEATTGDVKYDTGKHTISSVDRSYEVLWGKEGPYALNAPTGYKIVDYDYDFSDDSLEFDDYVYQNVVPITTVDKDYIGTPVDDSYDVSHKDGIYKPGEHVIVMVDRTIDIFFGKSDIINLEAPEGYKVVDYDYDKTSNLAFENILYENVVDVKVENVDSFGVPVKSILKNESNVYSKGEQKIVVLNGDLNIWFGKDDQFGLTAPKGYSIVDYDYDKTDLVEFETITYTNDVPVTKNGTNFGVPLESVSEQKTGYYKPGTHVIVIIERTVNLLYGKQETKEQVAPDGYMLLDYDYEYGDPFQFQTYVYVNIDNIQAEDINDFGRIIKK